MAVAVASLCDVPPPPLSIARAVRWTALLPPLVGNKSCCPMNSRAAGYRLYIEQGASGITPPARANAGLSWSLTHKPADLWILRSL